MTDAQLTNIEPQNQAVSSTSVATTQEQRPVTEKMVPQSVFDNAIKHEKYRVDERIAQARAEALEEYKKQYAPAAAQPVQQNTGSDVGQIVEHKLAQREAALRKQEQDAYGQKVLGDFYQKLDEGKQAYPDFEKLVTPIIKDAHANPATYGNFIHMLTTEYGSNAKDIMHEVATHKQKLAGLVALSKDSPNAAREALNEMVETIRANQEAQKVKNVNEPLSQIKPSNIGKGNDSASISAIRRNPKYRV